jgi:hypothetical protein
MDWCPSLVFYCWVKCFLRYAAWLLWQFGVGLGHAGKNPFRVGQSVDFLNSASLSLAWTYNVSAGMG